MLSSSCWTPPAPPLRRPACLPQPCPMQPALLPTHSLVWHSQPPAAPLAPTPFQSRPAPRRAWAHDPPRRHMSYPRCAVIYWRRQNRRLVCTAHAAQFILTLAQEPDWRRLFSARDGRGEHHAGTKQRTSHACAAWAVALALERCWGRAPADPPRLQTSLARTPWNRCCTHALSCSAGQARCFDVSALACACIRPGSTRRRAIRSPADK